MADSLECVKQQRLNSFLLENEGKAEGTEGKAKESKPASLTMRTSSSGDKGTQGGKPLKRFSVVELLNSPAAFEMVKFGLDTSHPVVDTFACCYYPRNKKLMVQGKLWLTSKYLAFAGWPLEMRILLPLKDLTLEKAKTVGFFENAINVTAAGLDSYFFASFLDRDMCYYSLKSAVAMEQHLQELKTITVGDEASGQDDAAAPHQQQLEFGIQTPKSKQRSLKPTLHASSLSSSAEAVDTSPLTEAGREDEEEEEGDACDIITSTRPRSTTVTTPLVKALLSDSDTILLLDVPVPHSCSAVFRECWLFSYHFRDFLTQRGETSVASAEWAPMHDQGVGPHPSDKSRIPFAYSRAATYNHMRSVPALSWLGPRFAHCTCTQYLYLFGSKAPRGKGGATAGSDAGVWSIEEALEGCRPQRGVVLSVAECAEGLLGGSSRVLTYWAFEQGADRQSCRVRCCVQVPLRSAVPLLAHHLSEGLVDRALLAARALHVYQAARLLEYSREQDAQEGGNFATVSPNAPGSVWSAREAQRVARFRRAPLAARGFFEVLEAQGGPEGFRSGRNSASLLHRMVLLLCSLSALLAACLVQGGANAQLAARLHSLNGELSVMRETLEERAREQAAAEALLSAKVVAPPAPPTLTFGAWLPSSYSSAKTGL